MNALPIILALFAAFYSLRGYRRRRRHFGGNRWAHVRYLALAGLWLGVLGFLLTGSALPLVGSALFLLLFAGAWELARRYDQAELAAAALAAEVDVGQGVPPLVAAAQRRDYARMGRLLAAGAEVDGWGPDGITAFGVCVRRGDLSGARTLLLAGAKPDQPVMDGLTALMLAGRWDKPALARLLLDAEADPERGGSRGETALGAAAAAGSLEVARLLLARGVNVNLPSLDNYSPLMRAASNGHGEMVELLLQHGAELGHRVGEGGVSALSLAVEKGAGRVVELLLQAAAAAGWRYQIPRLQDLIAQAEAGGFSDIAEQLRALPPEAEFVEEPEEELLPELPPQG